MSVFCWDFDGTLVWSEHLWSGSVRQALHETLPDYKVAFSKIREQMATGFTWHTPECDYSQMTGDKWWDFMNEAIFTRYMNLGLTRQQASDATAKVHSIIKRTENYNLFEDTVQVLRTAKDKGHTNVLLTNNYPDLADVLDALGLISLFDRVIISALVGYDKPRQEIFSFAKADFSTDEHFFMVGDNVTADIYGGNTAGMTTILVHKGYDEKADYCFDNLNEIIKLM